MPGSRRLAATLERGSEHPLAAAIFKGAEDRKVALTDAEAFDSVTGKGEQVLKGRYAKGEIDHATYQRIFLRSA